MKTISQLRESSMPKGEHVFDQKIKKSHLMIHKVNNKFIVYIDKEKFDTFNNLKDAKTAGLEFIKMAKG